MIVDGADMKLVVKLSNNLRRLREDRGLTQLDVSKATGITDVSLSRYETGGRIPKITAVYKLVKLYGVTMDSLFR